MPFRYFYGVKKHLTQDHIFDEFIREKIDCSRMYEDKFVFEGKFTSTKIYFTDTYHSLVRGKLKMSDGYKDGFFIIDTACTNCAVNSCFCEGNLHETEQTCNVIAAGNVSKRSKLYNFTYSVEDDIYYDDFQSVDNLDKMIGNTSICILGILGLTFLWQYKMIVDYKVGEIYTSSIDIKLNLEDSHFFFTLVYGLENWRLPIVGITNDKDEDLILAIIDTGSNANIMCKQAVDEFKFKHENTENKSEISYIYSNDVNEIAKIQFYILSQKL